MNWSMPIGVAILLVLCGSSQVAAEDCPASCDWGYGPENGPPAWSRLCCPVCDGRNQSPIDIVRADVVEGDAGPLELSYRESHFEFSNTGNTLQAGYELADGENYLEVGGVRYPLSQFHFHSLSEHTLDGSSSPLEIHFVHRRTSYDVVVLAALVEEGDHRAAFNPLWNSLPADSTVEPRTVVFNPRRLLPKSDLSYYSYRGSLTTPDCSEVVTWFVLTRTVNMASEQIEAFRRIYSSNYRPTQPLNGRVVTSGR